MQHTDKENANVETDRYFLANVARKKLKTSNATLASVPNRPDQETARRLVEQYATDLAASAPNYDDKFDEWSRQLCTGHFSLLLYGAGSKRQLLESFKKSHLSDRLCLEIDGYHPDASVKGALAVVMEEVIGAPPIGTKTTLEQARFVAATLEKSGTDLYLIVYGLDGPQLRSDKAVDAIAALVSCQTVRMIASVEHRLCQLLWDSGQLAKMRCLWCHAPTLLPYLDELPESAASTGLASIATGGGAGGQDSTNCALQMSGLKHLMVSLTSNARTLFVLLARRQLDRPGEPWPLDELYWACLDRMLVTSELTLHAHLKEFRDHGLVRLKTGGREAGDTVLVPLSADTLTQFLTAFGDDCDLV